MEVPKLAEKIADHIDTIPDRASGYKGEAISQLKEILWSEKIHQIRSTNIQQKTSSICESLGEWLHNHS